MPSIAQPIRPVTAADIKRVPPADLPRGLAEVVAMVGAVVYILARKVMAPRADGLVWDEQGYPLALILADDLDADRFAEVGDLAVRGWLHSPHAAYRDPATGTVAVGVRSEGDAR